MRTAVTSGNFYKGRGRKAGNISEVAVLQKHGACLIEGVGAKIDSSSTIIAKARGSA